MIDETERTLPLRVSVLGVFVASLMFWAVIAALIFRWL